MLCFVPLWFIAFVFFVIFVVNSHCSLSADP